LHFDVIIANGFVRKKKKYYYFNYLCNHAFTGIVYVEFLDDWKKRKMDK
jgi:hypothetical protein